MAYLEVNPKIQLFIKKIISVGPLQGLKTFYNWNDLRGIINSFEMKLL